MPSLFPALRRFSQEAELIGDLIIGYNALEYQLCICAGMGGGDVAQVIQDLFKRRIGETRRVRTADELGRSAYNGAGLGAEYASAVDDVLHCVSIRNQYAHCIWHDDGSGRLAFAHMEEIAVPDGPGADPARLTHHYVDVALLSHQAAFFSFVKDTLIFLNYLRRQRIGAISSEAILEAFTTIPRPPLYAEAQRWDQWLGPCGP